MGQPAGPGPPQADATSMSRRATDPPTSGQAVATREVVTTAPRLYRHAMPWSCPTCAASVPTDDVPCPGCGSTKAAWTLHQERTRTFRVEPGKRFEVLRGDGAAPLPAGHAAWHGGPRSATAGTPRETRR